MSVNPANLDNFTLDIGLAKHYVRFSINDTEVWRKSLRGMTTRLLHANVFRQFVKNNNTGSTTDSTLILHELGMYLLGDSLTNAAPIVFDQQALSDSLKMRGAGFLTGVLRQNTGQDFFIRDGTTATGRILVDADMLGVGYTPCNLYFADGLYFDHVGGIGNDDITVHVRG